MEPVETSQIYWGAVPFVMMHYKASDIQLDPAEVQRQFDNLLPVPGEGGGGMPDLPSFDLEPPKIELFPNSNSARVRS